MSGVFKDGAYYPLLGSTGNGALGVDDWPSDYAQDAMDFEDRLLIEDDSRRRADRKAQLESLLDGPFPGEWTVRGGTIIKIASMTDGHLDNAVKYFEREDLGDHPKIQELREERKRR